MAIKPKVNKSTPAAKPAAKIAPPAAAPSKALARTTVDNPGAAAPLMSEFMKDAGKGLQGITKEDLAIPRMAIIQATSDYINKSTPEKYVKGAQIGQVIENVTNELFDASEENGGLSVIFVHFTKIWIEVKFPFQKKNGFVGTHSTPQKWLTAKKSENPKDKGAMLLPNGNEIFPQVEYYAMLIDTDESGRRFLKQCLLSFRKSDSGEARKLATLLTSYQAHDDESGTDFTPPAYYRAFKLYTVPKNNESGNWIGWRLGAGEDLIKMFGPDEGMMMYRAARGFDNAIAAGDDKVKDLDPDEHVTGSTSEHAPI